MLLTKLWASILALAAAAFLAGMMVLSLGPAGGFTDADRAAVRAATEAGLAAIQAEIQSSAVQRAPSLLTDSRLADALDKFDPDVAEDDPRFVPLEQILADVSEENLLGDFPKMTVGIVDREGKVVAGNGIGKGLLDPAAQVAMRHAKEGAETLLSATLGGRLHVVMLSRPTEAGYRLLAIQPLPTGAGSLLRRVLGTQHPAALVRNGKIVGDLIGDLQVGPQIERLATEHAEDAPEDGASDVFVVGSGLDARIGAIGRVPGPAGQGDDATMLVVLSRATAAAGTRSVGDAIDEAIASGRIKDIAWPAVLAVLALGIGLAFYLPQMEVVGPLRRLAGELEAIAQGTQHQVFHDRYTGVVGEVARAAVLAQEALHAAYLAEQAEGGEDEARADQGERKRPKTRSRRALSRSHRRAPSRAHKAVPAEPEAAGDGAATAPPAAIDLPEDSPPGGMKVESHSHAEPEVGPVAAPSLFDDEPPPDEEAAKAELALTPEPTDTAAPEDPREAYFREVFEEFLQVKETCGEPTDNLTYEKFAQKLRKNTEQLLARPGVKDVEFSVYIKDGKAALKAKVVKA